jgi:hypothetical protein
MRLALWVICASVVAHAQVQTFASRSVRLEASVVRYQVSVDAPATLPEEGLYAALAGLPLDGEHLVSSDYYPGGVTDDTQDVIGYDFAFTTPLGDFREMARKLEALRTNPPDAILRLDYEVSAQVSADAAEQAQARLSPLLLAEAQERAEVLARASGRTLGALRSVQPIVASAGYGQPVLAQSDRFNRTDGGTLGEPYGPLATISIAVVFDLQ